MTSERLAEIAATHRDDLLNDIVPFWTRHSVDREFGGFLTFLDRDGRVYGPDKPIWLQGRIAWLFAHLYNEVGRRPEWLELSRHGIEFLEKAAFDTDGRMFFVVARDGRPLRKRRYLFSETFGTMAFAEYARATGDDRYRQRAADLFDLILRYLATPGLLEPKEIQTTRPSKSHAMPMILVATAQIARQVDDRPVYDKTIDRSLYEIFHHFAKPEHRALLETVGPNGEFIDTPEGRCINPGHAIETAWFIFEEAVHRGDDDLWKAALPILDWSLERGWDREFGGLFYFQDVFGEPCVQYEWDMKLWWPHTEALVATLFAYELTGDAKWAEWYERIHEYTWSHFPDRPQGEWFGYLHRDGTVSHRQKGNLWKGPYHVSRMMLRCWKRAERMAAES